ncbi:MAG: ATP-binding protein [Holosporaceae bacterium]|nr:ATP-binding protein [Holosporaceae bacterium]
MEENRHVKWSEEALEFFNAAAERSITLNAVISYGCSSQSGEGFEDLVNSLNLEETKKKLKKINIVDTSYLYRHVIPDFNTYSDPSIETLWLAKNKESINKLQVDTVVKPWIEGISSNEFKKWHKQILKDYAGDQNGEGLILSFRDLVISDASIAAYKGNNELSCSIDFLLEELAYICVNFQNPTVLVYPMNLARSMEDVAKRYKLSIKHLRYKTSKQSQKSCKHSDLNAEILNAEVSRFMKETVSNVNFFVIDKYGNHIYKNYALDQVIGGNNAKKLNAQAWKTTTDILKTRKEIITEEEYLGISYLVVKSPLIIEGKVEGVIGLAVNITERKKNEKLELRNKVQEKLRSISEQVVHDIRSPIAALSTFVKICKELKEKDVKFLESLIESVNIIVNDLLDKHKKYSNGDCKNGLQAINTEEANSYKEYIEVHPTLLDIISQKIKEYEMWNLKINYSCPNNEEYIFVKGNKMAFKRMISNVIDNALEALRKESGGSVDILISKDVSNIKILVRDNGKGMPKETIEKIMNKARVASDKIGGYGVGLTQLRSTLEKMNGDLEVLSEMGVGTDFIITIPISEKPHWFASKIILHKGNIVVIVDDEPLIHYIWERRLKDYSGDISIKCFSKYQEAMDFIETVQEKKRMLLLVDYELKSNDVNGITFIEKNNMQKQSILVTGFYNKEKVRNSAEKSGIRILPKFYISEVLITLKKERRVA